MYAFRFMQTHRSSKMPFPTKLYAGALPLEDIVQQISCMESGQAKLN